MSLPVTKSSEDGESKVICKGQEIELLPRFSKYKYRQRFSEVWHAIWAGDIYTRLFNIHVHFVMILFGKIHHGTHRIG